MRLLVGRRVADGRRIEPRNIGLHPWTQHAAIGQPQARGGEGGHLPDRILQRQHVLVADVDGQHAGESAVTARMRVGAAEHRHLAVGGDHRRRMLQDADDIVLTDRVKNPRASALLDNPHRGLGRVFDRLRHVATMRGVGERFAVQ